MARAPGVAFAQKFTKRAIDWAIVGVAVQGGNVALVNMGPARSGRPRWSRRSPTVPRPPTPLPTPPKGPAPSTTSTQTPATGSTWPGCSSPAP